MKRRVLYAGALLGVSSFLMLSGFDSAETVESILEKNRATAKEQTSVSYDIEMNADLTLDVSSLGMTVSMSGSGDVDAAATTEPLAVYLNGEFSGQAVGQSGQVKGGLYLVTEEDGAITLYTGVDDEWTSETVPAEEAEKITSLFNQTDIKFADMPVSYTLADQAVDVDGKECYQLSTALNWDDVKTVIAWSSEQAKNTAAQLVAEVEEDPESLASSVSEAEEQLDDALAQLNLIDSYVEGLLLNVTVDIACDTYETQAVRIDMEGSDWSNVINYLKESGLLSDNNGGDIEVNLDIKDLYILMKNNGPAAPITVPEDIIAKAGTQSGVVYNDDDDSDVQVGTGEEDGNESSNSISYKGISITFDEAYFDYLYTDENYISGSLYDPYYSVYGRVNNYTDSEEDIREEQEWEAGYYTENYEKSSVSEVESGTMEDGTAFYRYVENYENSESGYASSTWKVYLLKDDGRCVSFEFNDLPDTFEEITLSQENVDEMMSHITVEW